MHPNKALFSLSEMVIVWRGSKPEINCIQVYEANDVQTQIIPTM